MRIVSILLVALALAGCAGRNAGGPIVDMKGVDPAQYRIDRMECQDYAEQVAVGGRAAGGAAAGAVVGGARGTGDAVRERQQVVRNCLRNRGYAVLN